MAYGLEQLRETFEVSEGAARAMRGNRATDTAPELQLRKALWANGRRGYRKNVRSLPGAPDIVYFKKRCCVFLNGCFWHGCQQCRRKLVPTRNAAYWQEKISRNRARDARNHAELAAKGWRVVVVWECELRQDPEGVLMRVGALLDGERLRPEEPVPRVD